MSVSAQLVSQIVKVDCLTRKTRCKLLGTGQRSVGHAQRCHVGVDQVLRRQFAHLTSAQQHGVAGLQIVKYLTRQLHGCRADREVSSADIRFTARPLTGAQ